MKSLTQFHSLLAHIVDSNVIHHIGKSEGVNDGVVSDTALVFVWSKQWYTRTLCLPAELTWYSLIEVSSSVLSSKSIPLSVCCVQLSFKFPSHPGLPSLSPSSHSELEPQNHRPVIHDVLQHKTVLSLSHISLLSLYLLLTCLLTVWL